MSKSLGLLETRGLSAGFSALDTMLKTANISYVTDEKKLGAGLVTVIIEGNLSAVKSAVEAGKKTAAAIVGDKRVLTAATIARPHPVIYSLIKHEKYHQTNIDKINSETNEAVGLIEIYGYSAALIGTDTALKSANVYLMALDKTKGKPHTPGLIMFLKLGGKVDDVKMAIKATIEKITPLTGSTSSSVIARPDRKLRTLIRAGI